MEAASLVEHRYSHVLCTVWDAVSALPTAAGERRQRGWWLGDSAGAWDELGQGSSPCRTVSRLIPEHSVRTEGKPHELSISVGGPTSSSGDQRAEMG